jgi:transposase
MARPTKRTPEREKRLLQAIRAGNTRRAAAAYAGISDDSLERWAKRCADFADALTRAEAESEVALVAIVRQAASQDWRAAMAILERRWPDSWGKREKLDLDVYVRARARELGLEEDFALQTVRERLRLVG